MSGICCTMIAPLASPLSVQRAHYTNAAPESTASLNVLASLVGGGSMQQGSTFIDQKQHLCAISIAHTCHIIEECHKDMKPRHVSSLLSLLCVRQLKVLQSPSFPPILRLLVEKTIRYARRVIRSGRDEIITATFLLHEKSEKARNHLERSIRLLRREIVRTLRKGELELKYSHSRESFRTSGKDLMSGTTCGRSEVASFVDAVCYAVTREVGSFPFSLLRLKAAT